MGAAKKTEKVTKAEETPAKDAAGGGAKEAAGEVAKLSPAQKVYNEVRDTLKALEKAASKRDERTLVDSSKHNRFVRSTITPQVLQPLLEQFVSAAAPQFALFQTYVEALKGIEMTDTESAETFKPDTPKGTARSPMIPEVEIYLQLLFVMLLFDRGMNELTQEASTLLVKRVHEYNRRTLDRFSAKAYFFHAMIYEKLGKLSAMRPQFLAAHRSACLRHDEPGQAVLSNIILRSYLSENLFNQAHKFILNSKFPEKGSNYQFSRFLYYKAIISTVQLRYSDAFNQISQALRKAPQTIAMGFRQTAAKLLVVVQLLMGEIPERSLFFENGIRRSLHPYFELAKAVRVGDLAAFEKVQVRFKDNFVKDKAQNFIIRLRFNVIKTGLRKINMSYSRISVADISKKLCLPSVEDAEYIVAKAIHDAVIDAVIDDAEGDVYSKDNVDVYSTKEPQSAFDRRIKFCLEVHNEAVKAMRYPEKNEEDEPDEQVEENLEAVVEELDDEELDDLMD